jgi:hypothetical protein
MHETIPVTWSLHGEVNSHQFALTGTGSADLANGTVELHLNAAPSFPAGFDPAVAQFMCNYPLAGYAAVPAGPVSIRDAVASELFVRPRRQVEITDASGEQIVRLEALTTMTITADAISVTNYMTGISHLPADVVRAHGEETLVPGAPGAATGVSQYDDAREETPGFVVGTLPHQLGIYIVLDMPQRGGDLTVYDRQYRPQDGPLRQGYGLDPKAMAGDVFVGTAPQAGDLILFPDRHIHQVDACSGSGQRIKLQAHLGVHADGSVVCWS